MKTLYTIKLTIAISVHCDLENLKEDEKCFH